LSKAKGKRSYLEAFEEEMKAEPMIYATLSADKQSRRMAEREQRLAEHEQKMAELHLRKHQYDLKAKEKAYESELKVKQTEFDAEERRMAAQHQREREKEKHEEDMLRLRLRLEYQTRLGGGESSGGIGLAGASVPFDPFANPDPFGTLGMDSKCLALVLSQTCC
jgi:hypothetical protein